MAQSFRDLVTLRARPAADVAAGARRARRSCLVHAVVWWLLDARRDAGDAHHLAGAAAEPGRSAAQHPDAVHASARWSRARSATLKRVFSGFGLAILVGVPLGILAGSYRIFDALTGPLSLFARNIPVAVLIPLTILWFGIDETQKTMFIFIATAPFVFFDAARAVIDVHERYVETAQTLGASSRQIVTKVLIALALPDIFASLRNLFGLAFGYIMLAELVNAKYGLGYLLMTQPATRAHRAHLRDSHRDRAARVRHRPPAALVRARTLPVSDRRRMTEPRRCRTKPAAQPAPVAAAAPASPPPIVQFENVTKTYDNGFTAIKDVTFCRRRQAERDGVHHHPRSVGVREVDDAATHRRTDAAVSGDVGHGARVGPAGARPGRRSRHGLPGLHVVRQPHGRGQRRVRSRVPRRCRRRSDASRRASGSARSASTSTATRRSIRISSRAACVSAWPSRGRSSSNPQIILMDEPFGALDPRTRLNMQDMLVSLSREAQATVFFVTHSIEEAVYLGDRTFIILVAPGNDSQGDAGAAAGFPGDARCSGSPSSWRSCSRFAT